MRVFTLAVLPAHPAQMPVIAKNVTVQGGEDRPRQNGPQVVPISKVQGGQVHGIAHLNSCVAPRGRHLWRGFLIPAAATAANTAAIGVTPACWPPSYNKVGKLGW